MLYRILGVGGILGGLALMFVELRHAMSGIQLSGATIDSLEEMGYLVWGLGLVCIFWAMFAIRATGRNPFLRAIPILGVIGGATMAFGSLTDILGVTGLSENPIFFISWPLILVGTVVTGILAPFAPTWEGWRKFAALVVLLSVPVMLVLTSVIGPAAQVAFGLSFVFLGFAVYTTPDPVAVARPVNAVA